MREKTLILFDIGAVLVRLDFRRFYKAAAQYSLFDVSAVEKLYQESSLEDLATEGKIDAQEFYQQLRTVLSLPASVSQEKLIYIIEQMWPGQIEKMVALKRELSEAGYAVGLFSNIGEFAHTILSKKFPNIFAVYNPNNPTILSYKIKAMKPEPAIYAAVPRFSQIIFIEDKDQYLRMGIENYGWYGIHFTKYIDKAEPDRKSHADVGYHSEKLRNANSFKAVRQALMDFGVTLQ